jgi:hypothetical protein
VTGKGITASTAKAQMDAGRLERRSAEGDEDQGDDGDVQGAGDEGEHGGVRG